MHLRRTATIAASSGLVAAFGGLTGMSMPVAAGAAASAAQQATVVIQPGVVHAGHAMKQPPTTADCEAAFKVACYEPAQIQRAYNLQPLYSHGVNGKGTTIVIVDSFGSPTIAHDLGVFDKQFGLPAPPSLTILQPAGKVPTYNPNNGDMVGWAGETTLDVEYAHTIAPDAKIVLVETPVSETEGVTGFPQIVTAEEYVINHHIGDVISQSFSATEETFPTKASLESVRGAYFDAYQHHVTALSAAGDSGVSNVEDNGVTNYLYPTVNWPPSDPLITGIGGTQLHLNASGAHTSPDTVWNDTYSVATNQFIFGDNGPNPLAGGGGKSVYFTRPFYQNGPQVRSTVGKSRGVPDISMSGACNGAVDTYQSFGGQPAGWVPVCGTSEATPLFAGIVALADQVAGHPLGLINPALYFMSEHHLPGIVPVTSGNNTVSFSQGGKEYTIKGYNAKAVYSLAAGVGTVNGALFVPELAHLARWWR